MTEFIQGIEVLHVTDIMTCPDWAKYFVCIGLICTLISCIMIINLHDIYNDWGMGLNIGFILIFMMMLLVGGIRASHENIPTGKYEYQVTIDDTVPATYLYENFEVISQEGKIWTIRQKTE